MQQCAVRRHAPERSAEWGCCGQQTCAGSPHCPLPLGFGVFVKSRHFPLREMRAGRVTGALGDSLLVSVAFFAQQLAHPCSLSHHSQDTHGPPISIVQAVGGSCWRTAPGSHTHWPLHNGWQWQKVLLEHLFSECHRSYATAHTFTLAEDKAEIHVVCVFSGSTVFKKGRKQYKCVKGKNM